MITKKERKLLILLLIVILAMAFLTTIIILNNIPQEEKMPQTLEIVFNAETQPIVEVIPETQTTEETSTEEEQEFRDRCRLDFAESGGECLEGQIAVMAVILNREESENFPDNFYDVINQSKQFAPVWNGEIHVPKGESYAILKYEDVSEQTIEAVERALNGEDPTEQLLWDEAVRLGLDPVKYAKGGALYFYNPNGCTYKQLVARSTIKVKIQIGNHIFYKVWDT